MFIVFYVMIDALNFWNGSPFRYPGEYVVEFVYINTPTFATVMTTVCRHSFVVLSVLQCTCRYHNLSPNIHDDSNKPLTSQKQYYLSTPVLEHQ